MNHLIRVLMVGMALLPSSGFAIEAGVLGGLKYDVSTVTLSSAVSGGVTVVGSALSSPTYGIVIGQTIVPLLLGLEANALRIQRNAGFSLSAGGINVGMKATVEAIHVPLMIRLLPIPILSPGVGVYYTKHDSKMSITTDLNGKSSTQDFDLDKLKVNRTDMGWVASLRAEFGIIPTFLFFVDGRYQSSFKNLNGDPDIKFKLHETLGLVGMSFRFM